MASTRHSDSRRSRKAPVVFVAVGLLLTAADVDILLQAQHGAGTVVDLAFRSQSVSTHRGTSGSSSTVGIVEYEAGGRAWRLEGPLVSFFEPGAIGGTVDVWYYRRWPRLAWVYDRWAGPLAAGVFIVLYWVMVVAGLRKRLPRLVGR